MTANSNRRQQPILVIGATGKTGRRVVEQLEARGVPTRSGSRSAEPPFDWNEPATWPAVLEGAGSAYITYYPDLAAPGAVEATGSFAQLATERDVTRLVLLAGRGEAQAEEAEEAVRASGADLTVVRATWFSQNFSEGEFLGQVLDGLITLPAGETPEPFVDADDIADVVVASLLDDRHIGELYELTGPDPLTFGQATEEIAVATGRTIRYEPPSIKDFAAGLAEQGAPSEVVEQLVFLFGEVLDGRNSHTMDGVQRALGREPRDFRSFARAAAATGVWNPAPAINAA